MPVELSIVESVTTLDTTVVEVILESTSTPGPAGPGVPVGGTAGQVLTKDSGTDYATSWQDPTGGGGGAPTDADYLVGTANGTLTNEIVVGATPGGELGGTWASPTVDATHSGSSHAAVQAAAEATAAAALAAHEADTTSIHGIADTSALETTAGAQAKVDAHVNDATDAHDASAISNVPAGGIAATDVQTALNELDTDKAAAASAVMDGDAAGGVLSGTYPNPGFASDMATQAELDAHITDASAAHAASAISVADTGGNFTATDVEAVLAEIAPQLGGGFWDATIVKQADETVAASTTLQADDELAFSVLAGVPYFFEALLLIAGTGAGSGSADFKCDFSLSAGSGSTSWRQWVGLGPTTGVIYDGQVADLSTALVLACRGDTGPNPNRIMGMVVPSDNATLTFRWAQNASGADGVVLKAGSTLSYRAMVA